LDEGIVRFGKFSIEDGYAMTSSLLESSAPYPDAVFAAADVLAVGVLRRLTEAGLRVPEDVALMGFDDLPYSTICTPRLSTIRQPVRELGIAAMGLLFKRIDDPGSAVREIVLSHELVVREST
jgi:DNA-binding LacI/PurR family transcriptional regulator